MAIGIVSNEEFDVELAKFTSSSRQVEHRDRNPKLSDPNVPASLRQVIQEEAIKGTPPKELSKIFGVDSNTIGSYKHGYTENTRRNTNEALVRSGQATRIRIASKAQSKIISAMRFMTDDKLQHAKARDLAGIAKDMSTVVNNMEGNSSNSSNQNNFVFFSPRTKQSDEYEVIEVHK